jgi:hypothetical protein
MLKGDASSAIGMGISRRIALSTAREVAHRELPNLPQLPKLSRHKNRNQRKLTVQCLL